MKRAFLLLLLALAACGPPSVKDVCKKIDEQECFEHYNLDDCVADGDSMKTAAAATGCSETFDDYMRCLGEEVCNFETGCASLRDEMAACVGAFPQ